MSDKKLTPLKNFTKGILAENPVLRLVLGTCPALAVTTTGKNGLGMGLAATFVLLGSNIVISLLRNVIPNKVRIPSFIVIIAGFVSIVQMLMKAYLQDLDRSLGIFIPLIVVNCIILARAEMFASKNSVLPSIIDALGMGAGFTAALVLMGSIREILGNGSFFDLSLPVLRSGGVIEPILIFILPPGGFFVFGILIALSQKLTQKLDKNAARKELKISCGMCKGCEAADNCSEKEG
ncbi:MAG: electron transport complex subunit E [Eubacteriales bacterium]|nr:electron transport complex subunit E [Eubacteriales bacterium]